MIQYILFFLKSDGFNGPGLAKAVLKEHCKFIYQLVDNFSPKSCKRSQAIHLKTSKPKTLAKCSNHGYTLNAKLF